MSICTVPSVYLRIAGYVLVIAAFFTGLERPVAAADIWMGSIEPAKRSQMQEQEGLRGPSDYMDLFRPDAPWASAASGLKALKISTAFGLQSTDDDFQRMIDELKRRHIALAVELGVLVGSDRCGRTFEGYRAPNTVEALAKRVKKFGGQLDYVAMDEPVWQGHTAKGGGRSGPRVGIAGAVRCQDPVSDLVDQIAPKVAVLREIFPNVQAGQIDVINGTSPQQIEDMVLFADLYHKKTNMPLAFVHADISWQTNWQPLLEKLAGNLHERGIRIGVVCNGDRADQRNEEWVNKALQRCQTIAADSKVKADDFLVQSWHPLPTRMRPETDPGALTFAVKQAETILH